MIALEPYLNFNGNGREALDFYAKALDGQVVFSQTFGESPMGDKTPEEFKGRLMHAVFQAENVSFMASDGPPGFELVSGNNVSLSLHAPSVDRIEKAYNGLAEGGTITMPLQETFWAQRFGMLVDRYGIQWMFNVEKEKK